MTFTDHSDTIRAMENTEIDLFTFGILDSIAKEHKVKDIPWADAAEITNTRISEVRRMYNLYLKGMNYKVVGRSFSISKCTALVTGLKKILGGDFVKKTIFKKLSEQPNRRHRLLLMCLSLNEEDEEQVELFLKAIFQVKKSR